MKTQIRCQVNTPTEGEKPLYLEGGVSKMIEQRELTNLSDSVLKRIVEKRDKLNRIIGNLAETNLAGKYPNTFVGDDDKYKDGDARELTEGEHRVRLQSHINPGSEWKAERNGCKNLSHHTGYILEFLRNYMGDEVQARVKTDRGQFETLLLTNLNYHFSEAEKCRLSAKRYVREGDPNKLAPYCLSQVEYHQKEATPIYEMLAESLATPYADREPSTPKTEITMGQSEWEEKKKEIFGPKMKEGLKDKILSMFR